MTGRELKEICLSLPDAREEFPFRPSLSVFKAGGRIFAISDLDAEPPSVSVKCDPDLGAQLRHSYASIVPGYHLDKRHWLTVTLDGSVPDDLVAELVRGSHELVHAARRGRG